MRRIEIVGQKMNKLLVLEEFKKNNRLYCKCVCDCGNKVIVSKDNLLSGHTTSCGCLIKNKEYENLIGKKIGKLTVLEEIKCNDKNGHHHYRCRCECGKEVEVLGNNLIYEQTTSCGCYRKEKLLSQKIRVNNKSGKKGVYFDNKMQKWVAKITINGRIYKSFHQSKDDAIEKRKYYEEIYHKPIIDKIRHTNVI